MGERLELCIMMKNQLSGTGVFGTGQISCHICEKLAISIN